MTTERPAFLTPARSPKRQRFERQLFSTLLAILLFPSAFFILMSYVQLQQVLGTIHRPLESKAGALIVAEPPNPAIDLAAVALEHDVMNYRHQRTTALLATRTWMRFMSLIFGALLVVIGCSFILGRVTGPVYEGEVSLAEASGSLKSTSPGLFLIAAGIVLIAIPNLSKQVIETNDTSSYFRPRAAAGAAGEISDADLQDILNRQGGTKGTPP